MMSEHENEFPMIDHVRMIGFIAERTREMLAKAENGAGDKEYLLLPAWQCKQVRRAVESIIAECEKCEAVNDDMEHPPERVDPDAAVWIVGATEARCENCSGYGMTNMAYCPNCGKRMEGIRTFCRKDEEP